jgi:hypothetical protein
MSSIPLTLLILSSHREPVPCLTLNGRRLRSQNTAWPDVSQTMRHLGSLNMPAATPQRPLWSTTLPPTPCASVHATPTVSSACNHLAMSYHTAVQSRKQARSSTPNATVPTTRCCSHSTRHPAIGLVHCQCFVHIFTTLFRKPSTHSSRHAARGFRIHGEGRA